MDHGYLSWWAAGIGLGVLAAARWVVEGRLLGVSGLVERTIDALSDREKEASARAFAEADPDAIQAAVLAATEQEFGETQAPTSTQVAPARFVSLRAALFFIIAIALGGTIAAAQRGTLDFAATLGPVFEARFGGGWLGYAALVGGGALVGLGTAMAGGCTSGHGLSGCSRFQRGSLVATATFMACGVAVALALGGIG